MGEQHASAAWLSDDMARGVAALSTGVTASAVRAAADQLEAHAHPDGVVARLCLRGLSARAAHNVVVVLRALRDGHAGHLWTS